MDAETLEKDLEKQLICSICLETYTDPKQLQCNHIFCQQCLDRLSVWKRWRQLTIACPSCRHVTTVSEISSLPAAFHISQLLEILDKHKKKAIASAGQVYICSEHDTKAVDLYCETCGELICWKCIKKDGKHCNHDYEELDEAFEKCKGDIAEAVEPMKEHLPTVEESQTHLEQRKKEISNQQETIETEISDSIDQLHRILDSRKAELISKLQRITQAKLNILTAQQDRIKTIHAQLVDFLEFTRKSQQRIYREEVLNNKTSVLDQIKKFTLEFQSDFLKPNVRADIRFSSLLTLLVNQCQCYGEVEVNPEIRKGVGKLKKQGVHVNSDAGFDINDHCSSSQKVAESLVLDIEKKPSKLIKSQVVTVSSLSEPSSRIATSQGVQAVPSTSRESSIFPMRQRGKKIIFAAPISPPPASPTPGKRLSNLTTPQAELLISQRPAVTPPASPTSSKRLSNFATPQAELLISPPPAILPPAPPTSGRRLSNFATPQAELLISQRPAVTPPASPTSSKRLSNFATPQAELLISPPPAVPPPASPTSSKRLSNFATPQAELLISPPPAVSSPASPTSGKRLSNFATPQAARKALKMEKSCEMPRQARISAQTVKKTV